MNCNNLFPLDRNRALSKSTNIRVTNPSEKLAFLGGRFFGRRVVGDEEREAAHHHSELRETDLVVSVLVDGLDHLLDLADLYLLI